MATNQPEWIFSKNLGDVDPIAHGGAILYLDKTGVYPPELEVIEPPEVENRGAKWTVYRYALDRCKVIQDPESHVSYLVPYQYESTWPHPLHQYDEWFHRDLARVAESTGDTYHGLIRDLCSGLGSHRARAYMAIASYHGIENFDSYPLQCTRGEVIKRLPKELR